MADVEFLSGMAVCEWCFLVELAEAPNSTWTLEGMARCHVKRLLLHALGYFSSHQMSCY